MSMGVNIVNMERSSPDYSGKNQNEPDITIFPATRAFVNDFLVL
jgi:hypothetical protein